MKFYLSLLFAFFLSLVGFYFFSLQVKHERFTRLNFDTTVRLQDNIPQRLDTWFEDAAFFVSPFVSSITILVLTGIASIGTAKRRFRFVAVLIPLLFAALVGIEIYGKDRVESPAPPFLFIKNPTTHFPKYHVQDGYSYPSGHAGRGLYIAGVITIIGFVKLNIHEGIKQRRYMTFRMGIFILSSIIFLLFSLFVSIGKVYLGHHWISDIIGGWIVAIACLWPTLVLLRNDTNET